MAPRDVERVDQKNCFFVIVCLIYLNKLLVTLEISLDKLSVSCSPFRLYIYIFIKSLLILGVVSGVTGVIFCVGRDAHLTNTV